MDYESHNDISDMQDIFPAEKPITADDNSFNKNGRNIIKVIGVGGGGGNAIENMYKQNISGVSFVAINTDMQALKNLHVPEKLQLGPGLGAGGRPEKGKMYAEENSEDIARLFDDDTKMVFITAGMGGGTGTGASPVVARIAREKGVLTIGIVTIPFMFEGNKKILQALDGAKEMSNYVDALLIINNERLTEIYRDLSFDNAFAKADDTLTMAAKSISDMINMKGKINIDFEDVKTTLKDGGTAIISSGYGEGENRVTKAIQEALNSPLLKNRDIQTSKRFLFNIYYSNENTENVFQMGEMDEMNAFMANFAKDVEVIWGSTIDNTLGDKVKITILAAGFEATIGGDTKINLSKPKKKVEKEINEDPSERIAEEYGKEKVAERDQRMALAHYIVLNSDQLDNDTLINFIEKNPTFRRGNEPQLREEWKQLTSASVFPKEQEERSIPQKKQKPDRIEFD